MKTVILCGGLGKRLRPITKIIPKPLLKVGEYRLIEILTHYLIKNNFKKIILASKYKSSVFKRQIKNLQKKYPSINFEISIERTKLGTCGPIRLLKNSLPDNFLVINGDIITNIKLNKKFNKFKKEKNLMCVFSKSIKTPFDFGKLIIKKNKIQKVFEKPITENEIIAGIYFLKKKIIEYIPKNEYYGMDQLIKKLIKLKKNPTREKILNEYWVDIGSHKTYNKIKKLNFAKKFKIN